MKLENKVALVTGAAAGMGKAQVLRFVREGAKVIGFSLSEERLALLKKK